MVRRLASVLVIAALTSACALTFDPLALETNARALDAGSPGQDVAAPADADDDGGPPNGADAAANDAGAPDGLFDAAPDASTDASADADTCAPISFATPIAFPYTPNVFTPRDTTIINPSITPPLVISSACVLDEGSGLVTGPLCPPGPVMHEVVGGFAVFHVASLSVAPGASLTLVGTLPAIFAVYGDARISGAVDVGAAHEIDGPGASISGCNPSSGAFAMASGGGGGGGAGGADARGGQGGNGSDGSGGSGGTVETITAAPASGCRGGDGASNSGAAGGKGGGAGGAIQISAAGALDLCGAVIAVGGGGRRGLANSAGDHGGGGGGGGSGGGILLEADMIRLHASGLLLAGGGAGGSAANDHHADGLDGADGSRTRIGGAPETPAPSTAGLGGCSRLFAEGAPCGGGDYTNSTGGGGGGGSAGRIQTHAVHACTKENPNVISYPPLQNIGTGVPCSP